jgi:glutamyl-tRNA reductase
MGNSTEDLNIVNARITHQNSNVSLIEALSFKDLERSLSELHSMVDVDECVILQTCNRTEIYIVGKECEDLHKMPSEYLTKRSGLKQEEAANAIEISMNRDALYHLLRVTSGLESMVVGEDQILGQVSNAYLVAENEDQILGQVSNAYLVAENANTVGPVLKTVFNRALSVGRRVRNETEINRGAISIGSVAVQLAEALLGSLNGKNVLVMGAGEIGTLVAKALASGNPNAIFIANRTYDRALRLAEELHGKAVKFKKLEEVLKDADVVICSTAAPHYLLTKKSVTKVMKEHTNRSDLMIIDISNPRNVEESVQEIEGVKLYNIDDLRTISEQNKEKRQEKMESASKIVDEALVQLEHELKEQSVSDVVSSLFTRAEEIRQKELTKALKMLGKIDKKKKGVIDALTFEIIEQTLVPLIAKLRKTAKNNDQQLIDAAVKLFGPEEE